MFAFTLVKQIAFGTLNMNKAEMPHFDIKIYLFSALWKNSQQKKL